VRGYVEVLRHYREISGIREALAKRLLQDRPAAFIGVDAPDFNLGLEARLKAAGIKSIHFMCPSIWAWRGGRAKKMATSVDHVLCLFPFEPELLRAHGVAATFVGHPLADAIPLVPPRAAARAQLGLDNKDTVVAVLPGSRRSEIQYIAPAFLQTVARLHALRPELRFVLPLAPGLRALLEPLQSTRARGAAATAGRAVTRRAGGLRRDTHRQRHGHAGGGAVQAAHGHRLQHERADLGS
jgi:lipid-A-disaccharide synthase